MQILQRIVFYNVGMPSLVLSLSLDFLVIGIGFKGRLAYHLKILEENKKLDREHYTAIYESYQRIERVAHDISHHLNYIASTDSIDHVHQYVMALKERSFTQLSRFTGNFDIDVVINSKINTIQNAGIVLKTKGVLPYHIEWLDSIDVSIIIGNALSNAIESCIRCDGHIITLAFKHSEDWLMIRLKTMPLIYRT